VPVPADPGRAVCVPAPRTAGDVTDGAAPILATLEKGWCAGGPCPKFRVAVHLDGTVEVKYGLEPGAKTVGHKSLVVPETSIRDLARLFEGVQFWTLLEKQFHSPARDCALARISFSCGGRTKSVMSGCPEHPALVLAEEAFEHLADIESLVRLE
jgi:hypothetical protein